MWHHPNHKPHSAEYGGQPYINDEFGVAASCVVFAAVEGFTFGNLQGVAI